MLVLVQQNKQNCMEKPSVMFLKEHSEVHETTERYADLGSPDVEEKEQVFDRGNNSEKHVSTFLWRDDGIELKASVKHYSTRNHDFQSAEVDFFDSDSDSDNEPDGTNSTVCNSFQRSSPKNNYLLFIWNVKNALYN